MPSNLTLLKYFAFAIFIIPLYFIASMVHQYTVFSHYDFYFSFAVVVLPIALVLSIIYAVKSLRTIREGQSVK